MPDQLTYVDAGIDVREHGEDTTQLREMVESTFHSDVMTGHGAFAGRIKIPNTDLVLVGNIEGLGTKLEVALEMKEMIPGANPFVGLGWDIFAHCVNHILPAEPFVFMDYIGSSHLDAEIVCGVVEGIANACRESRCAIIKGEIAAKASIYKEGHYDCVGCVIGIIRSRDLPDEFSIQPGDKILGLASNGIHSLGFSLFRMVASRVGASMGDRVPELGCTLGEEGLKPHRLYVKAVKSLGSVVRLKGVAPVTAGGIPSALPRILPGGMGAIIYHSEVINAMRPVFRWIQERGNVPWEGPGGMIDTFNLGIGLLIIVSRDQVDTAFEALRGTGEEAYVVGQVVEGDEGTVEFV